MKKIIFVAATVLTATFSFAQKENARPPFNQQKLDSLLRLFPNDSLLQNLLRGRFNSFESANPGAVLLNQTSRGNIYSMQPDNMPVLVPSMNTVENMPGSEKKYNPAPESNMPNPLQPKLPPERKKKNM